MEKILDSKVVMDVDGADIEVVRILKSSIRATVKNLYGLDIPEVKIEHPQNQVWGDYSSNVALVHSKELGQAPYVVARNIVDGLQSADIMQNLDSVETAGPGFINFKLKKSYHVRMMRDILSRGDKFGAWEVGKGLRVALEHSNVNPNKAAHIGHLRNAVLGQFIERVYEFIGYDVKVQYYVNDLGVQVSTSLLGLKESGSMYDPSSYKKYDHYMWDIYADISRKVSDSSTLKEKLNRLTLALDSRDPEISKEQRELSRKVLKDHLETFSGLGITYDLIVYESSIKDTQMWEKTFNILKSNKNMYYAQSGRSAGCWLVRMSDDSSTLKRDNKDVRNAQDIEEDKIIVRSNGVPTYTGKDIAYHMWKFGLLGTDFRYTKVKESCQGAPLYETSMEGEWIKDFTNSDIVIDVIDVKQTYAIDAVRKSLEYLGYSTQSSKLIHVNYGHVYLSKSTSQSLGYAASKSKERVAMSGRKGLGVKIDDFISMVDSRLRQEHGDFPNLRHIRNSAIKFDILRYDTFQDVVFDLDNALNFKGFTGPYIQYTHARAASLLEKAGYVANPEGILELEAGLVGVDLAGSELELLKTLYKFPEVVLESARKYSPNLICNYLYELCQKFNSFYNDAPIINAKPDILREFRLALTASAKQVVKNGLYLLGIEAVDRM